MMNKKNMSITSYILSVLIAGIVIAATLFLITKLLSDGLYPLASILSAIVIFLAMTYLRPRFTPYRWMGAGITIALLFTIYPILYTVFISFTNMSSGHLMSKNQAVARIEQTQFMPENGPNYQWTAFKAEDDSYALWLVSSEGAGFFVKPGQENIEGVSGQNGFGEFDVDGVPTSIHGYMRISRKDSIKLLTDLSNIEFGAAPQTFRIKSLSIALQSAQQYVYDESKDVMVDQQTGLEYSPIEGTFTSISGDTLTPGYMSFIGLDHYQYFLGTPGFRKPLGEILIWNLAFTFFSVFISFAVGLITAIMFEDLPGKRIIRALLIVPWPIPVLISVMIWRNMLHPDMGFVAPILTSIFGSAPEWFTNVFWTRFAIILVNVWLSYPYFYVITAGALRAIPQEIYSAAIVDGANPWQKFRYITLPLLLQILTPLIVASLTFNFNNFNVIYIFNYGLPAMANTIVPMGKTDILVSFVYRLAFVASNVADFGLAGAITVLLFILIAIMVVLQIRFANMFKEVN
ncbi:MAG: ABC transporter permease subunit [Anaerolineaceae bacterium]|nr:ABC transporter permease subunit [Anaerolineaceae bacterium]